MTYLMEPNTGAVDTLEGWKADFDACPENEREMAGWPEKFEDANLIEVIRNAEGDWVEV